MYRDVTPPTLVHLEGVVIPQQTKISDPPTCWLWQRLGHSYHPCIRVVKCQMRGPSTQTLDNLKILDFFENFGFRGVQAHLKSLVRWNYADSQMESFWRRVGVEIDFLVHI